jgi:hypothetical protein
VLQGATSRRIITIREDLVTLLELLRTTLRRQGARLHAGYVSQWEVHLVLQLGEKPLGAITRRFQHAYARMFNRAHQARGPLFRSHYHVLLFQHQRWLVRLAHYVHSIPRLDATDRNAPRIWWSSDAVYRGTERRNWVTTGVILRMLTHGVRDDRLQQEAYRKLFDRSPELHDVLLLRRGSEMDSRILGDAEFIATIWKLTGRRSPTRPRQERRLEGGMSGAVTQLIEQFIALNQSRMPKHEFEALRRLVTCDNLRSGSRKRPLPMVRGLCAYCLVERKIATAMEVARFFGCGSTPVSARRRGFYARMFRDSFGAEPEALGFAQPARTASRE